MVSFAFHVVHDLVTDDFQFLLQGSVFLIKHLALLYHIFSCLMSLEEFLFYLGKLLRSGLKFFISLSILFKLVVEIFIDCLQLCEFLPEHLQFLIQTLFLLLL